MTIDGKSIYIISKSSNDTVKVGEIIGENLRGGDVIALMGELGAGKTCMTKGIARGLGVGKEYTITSPTFTLINEYPGIIPLYHFDVYRLSGASDLEGLGYEEYFYGRGVSVIEWAEKIKDIIPAEAFVIKVKYINDAGREIELSGNIDRILKLYKEFQRGGFNVNGFSCSKIWWNFFGKS